MQHSCRWDADENLGSNAEACLVRLGVPSRHRRRFADAAVSQLRVHVWVVRRETRGFQQNQGFYSFEVKQTTMLLCKRAALLPDLTIQSFFISVAKWSSRIRGYDPEPWQKTRGFGGRSVLFVMCGRRLDF